MNDKQKTLFSWIVVALPFCVTLLLALWALVSSAIWSTGFSESLVRIVAVNVLGALGISAVWLSIMLGVYLMVGLYVVRNSKREIATFIVTVLLAVSIVGFVDWAYVRSDELHFRTFTAPASESYRIDDLYCTQYSFEPGLTTRIYDGEGWPFVRVQPYDGGPSDIIPLSYFFPGATPGQNGGISIEEDMRFMHRVMGPRYRLLLKNTTGKIQWTDIDMDVPKEERTSPEYLSDLLVRHVNDSQPTIGITYKGVHIVKDGDITSDPLYYRDGIFFTAIQTGDTERSSVVQCHQEMDETDI